MVAATEAYNNSAKDEAAEKEYENTKEWLETNFNNADIVHSNRQDVLSQWEETYKQNKEEQETLNDYIDELQDFEYEKIMYKIEFKIEVNERELEWLDYKITRLGDGFYNLAETMSITADKADLYSGD